MGKRQFRIINTRKGILNITSNELHEVMPDLGASLQDLQSVTDQGNSITNSLLLDDSALTGIGLNISGGGYNTTLNSNSIYFDSNSGNVFAELHSEYIDMGDDISSLYAGIAPGNIYVEDGNSTFDFDIVSQSITMYAPAGWTNSILFPYATTSNKVHTLQDKSGTLAHLDDIAGYVPYTGATQNVDLGVHDILATSLQLASGNPITWNTKYHTLNIPTGDGSIYKVGKDIMFDIHNATGATLLKGQVVYPDGTSTAGVSNVQLCLADIHETIETLLGIIPYDIPNGANGHVMVSGVIDPIDTSGLSEGPVYLSATTPGALTNTKPLFPNYSVLVGVVDSVSVNGVLTVDTSYNLQNTLTQAWDGSFRESIDCLISSDGTTITASLEQSGGGDLTMLFSDGFTMLDCTPPQTIALTPGTDTAPQMNYIYISQATKALTVSTSGFPSDEHIKVADVLVQSAVTTQTNDALVNRNWDDHVKSVGDNGHLLHITERLRQNHAEWNSGVAGTCTVSAPTLSDVHIAVTGGTVYQLHKQNFPVLDSSTGDDIHIVNDSVSPYSTVTNLNTQTLDSTGVTLANKSFSFVLWGVQNKTGETSHLMINIPKGSYAKNAPDDAVSDASNFSVYDIPTAFKGKGFLIARFTFVLESNGTSWSLYDTEDLRGKVPNSAAGATGGGGGGGVTEFDALTDTPSTKVGQALKLLRIGAGETAIEYETIENILAPTTVAYTDVDNNFTMGQTTNFTLSTNSGVFSTINELGFNTNIKVGLYRSLASSFPGIWLNQVTPDITNYAFLSGASGQSVFNTPAGEEIGFRIGNAQKVAISATGGVSIGDTIADQSTGTDAGANNLLVEGTILGSNLSGTNTGDNAVNTLYSGLATSKEDVLGNPTTDGDILSSTVAGVRSWITPSSGGGATIIYKLADESKTTGLQATNTDAELFSNVDASSEYIFECYIKHYAATTTPDIILRVWGASGVISSENTSTIITTDSTLTTVEQPMNGFKVINSTVNTEGVIIKGSFKTTSAGQVRLEWAQNTQDAIATTVKAGSYLKLEKV